MKKKNIISLIAIFIGFFSLVGLNSAEEKTDETVFGNRISQSLKQEQDLFLIKEKLFPDRTFLVIDNHFYG
jgi:hypothetical protein